VYLAGRFLRASALSSASCSPADRLAIFGSEDAEDADWERDLATWQAACDQSRLTSGRPMSLDRGHGLLFEHARGKVDS
jgi:hypothetical protein